MTSFGSLIRSYRLRAGLGLRTFAGLIDERASVVSAIESERRAPWRKPSTLQRVAEVLGLVETSNLWQKILRLAYEPSDALKYAEPAGPSIQTELTAELAWWWCSEDAEALDAAMVADLADFVGAAAPQRASLASEKDLQLPPLTELGIEWRVRRLLGRREARLTPAPVDVEAALENEAGVRLEIVPGLFPRCRVQACAVQTSTGCTFFVDRIMADSRPIASYRHLLALCFAPAALWQHESPTAWQAEEFRRLQASEAWAQCLRDCERFALAMLLPANSVLAGAQSAYSELVLQQGWLEVEDVTRAVRNRLAEQFLVPPALVHRRLVGWPCHLYGRIAQALAAEELTLPPLDWIVDQQPARQRTLFDLAVQSETS